MDSKALALETCSRYLSQVDKTISHLANVTAYLKPLVFEITQRIIREAIRDDDRGASGDTKFSLVDSLPHSTSNYSPSVSINGDQRESLEVQNVVISRRSMARFEAFVEGVSLATPNDPITSTRTPNRPPSNLLDLSVALPVITSRLGNLGAAIEGKKVTKMRVNESMNSIHSSNSATSDVASTVSSNTESTRSRRSQRRYIYPQVDQDDLVIRLELYIRSLKRVFYGTPATATETPANGTPQVLEECNAHREPSGLLRARVNCLCRAFIANVGSVTSIQPVLKALLGSMTKELLAVDVLGEDLLKAITSKILLRLFLVFARRCGIKYRNGGSQTHAFLCQLLLCIT